MATLTNKLSWSKSRDESLQTCPRQYYYNYYGSWGGWENNAAERTRQLYILKQLITRQIWAGQVVHDCIEHSLKNIHRGIEPLPVEKIVDLTLQGMRQDYRSSLHGKYLQHPKSCALFAHEYQLKVSDEEWKANADHVKKCLTTFYESEIFQQIQSLSKEQWLEIEAFSRFHLDDVEVIVKLDFCYRNEDQIVIVDWKTGKSDLQDNSIQLACYALYAQEKWNVAPSQIETVLFNLASNTVERCHVTEAEIESVKDYIHGSMADMRKYLKNPEANVGMEDDFPGTEHAWQCRRCNFQKLCPVRVD